MTCFIHFHTDASTMSLPLSKQMARGILLTLKAHLTKQNLLNVLRWIAFANNVKYYLNHHVGNSIAASIVRIGLDL